MGFWKNILSGFASGIIGGINGTNYKAQIAYAIENTYNIQVYDDTGCMFTIAKGSGESLQGYTASTVSVKTDHYIIVYDSSGAIVRQIPI